ncbi:class II aldolase/adducin family protein, partial [bacterium]|nr:class II aldolase/adducin family protein [bacterium]
MSQERSNIIANRWDDRVCAEFSEEHLLLYRSNLLGQDLRVTNYGGGNTSAKISMKDPLSGKDVEVLWVKGSGGDLGSMKLDGFSTLYMEKLNSLKDLYRGLDFEDEMVGYLPHCTFNVNPRAASIDTPLHAFVPQKHVDHVHPDAIIAIAAAKDGEKLTDEIFNGEIGWLPWQRPGFDLGLKLEALYNAKSNLKGIILGGHGLFTWGATAKECYEETIRIIQIGTDYLDENGSARPFGGSKVESVEQTARKVFVTRIAHKLRGKLSAEVRKVGHFNDSAEIMQFVNSNQAKELAALGTSCPDHFLRTKISPLFIDFDSKTETVEDVVGKLDALFQQYYKDYEAYYQRCRHEDSPSMRDAYPVV